MGNREDSAILRGSDERLFLLGPDGEEALFVSLRAGQRVNIAPCNYLGEREVTVKYQFVDGDSSKDPNLG